MRDQVIRCIKEFLNSNERIFFNENEFQLYLAREIEKCGYAIYLEYVVEFPYENHHKALFAKDSTTKRKNNQRMYIDIVVEKDGQYMPIELKYKTTNKQRNKVETGRNIFGIAGESKLLETQGAHNNGCYDFWRDVERIERVHRHYSAKGGRMVKGLAIMLTNDPQYWTLTDDKGSEYYEFRLKEGRQSVNGQIAWSGDDTDKDGVSPKHGSKKCPIIIEGNFDVKWRKVKNKFQYIMLP